MWLLETPTENAQKPPEPIPVQNLPIAFLYGYSVYTTFRWPVEPQWLQAHLQRLAHDAAAMNITFPWQLEHLSGYFTHPSDAVIRLTAVPDIPNFRALLKPKATADSKSFLLISFSPLPEASPHPLKLKTVPYQDPLATIKHGALTGKLVLRQQAVVEGFDDVLFVNQAGNFSEASTANIFFIQDEVLYTPSPDRDFCLNGITRQQILACAKQQGFKISDRAIAASQLVQMDGAFLCNAVMSIQHIASIDNRHFPWPDSAQKLLGRLKA